MSKQTFAAGLLGLVLFGAAATSAAEEPGWYGRVVVMGPMRERIRSQDIRYRPYRPLHFYGNTVRRQYYRGRSLPAPRDFLRGTVALARDHLRSAER